MPERPAPVEAARAGVPVVGRDRRVAPGHGGGELPVADGAGGASRADPLEPPVPRCDVRKPDLEPDLGAGLGTRHSGDATERDVVDREAARAEGLGRREGRRDVFRDRDGRVGQAERRLRDGGARHARRGRGVRPFARGTGGEYGADPRQQRRAQQPDLHRPSTSPNDDDETTYRSTRRRGDGPPRCGLTPGESCLTSRRERRTEGRAPGPRPGGSSARRPR